MILNKTNWNQEIYQEFICYLYTFQDNKYQSFHARLLKDETIINIGIRTPVLKKLAKEISKGNYLSFINCIEHKYYEEDVIYGLILGYIKISWEERLILIKQFLPFVNNWATNDLVCANLKIFKKEQKEGLNFIQNCLNSKKKWTIRFGIVLLIDFYIDDNNIDWILNICKNFKHTEYYVLMALAWLISMCYIKYPKQTFSLLKSDYLDDFTHRKAIQKIIDSKQVKEARKKELKRLRRSK